MLACVQLFAHTSFFFIHTRNHATTHARTEICIRYLAAEWAPVYMYSVRRIVCLLGSRKRRIFRIRREWGFGSDQELNRSAPGRPDLIGWPRMNEVHGTGVSAGSYILYLFSLFDFIILLNSTLSVFSTSLALFPLSRVWLFAFLFYFCLFSFCSSPPTFYVDTPGEGLYHDCVGGWDEG